MDQYSNQPFRSASLRAAILAFVLGLAVAQPRRVAAGESPVECSVLHQSPDGLFVDAGSDQGLKIGARGTADRDGERVAVVEVAETSSNSALLRVLWTRGSAGPAVGDRISIVVRGGAAGTEGETSDGRSPTLKTSPGEDDTFFPLLAPPENAELVPSNPTNVFHGNTSLRQVFQIDPETDQDYSTTRLGSRGSLQRIGGTPWLLEWTGDVVYRDGKGLEDTRDYQDFRLYAYRLALSRSFEDGSSVMIGRFLPRALPAVGYLDGVQGEKVISEHLRLGGMVGLKPKRGQLEFSVREPTAVPYLTFEAGTPEEIYYAGTVGVLGSLYEGDTDRLAILANQGVRIGPRLSVDATAEVDFDVSMEKRSGIRLTHLDVFASYRIAPAFTLRAGADHYERPDTEAVRDNLDFEDRTLQDEYFDRGYWRYWVGAVHELPWNLVLSEEVAFIESPSDDIDDYEPRWRASLTRIGLPLLADGSVTISAYTFEGSGMDGYGGRVSSHLPLLDQRLSLDTALTFQYVETDADSDEFSFTDVSARVNWLLSPSWSVYGGVAYSFGTEVDRFLGDFGVRFQW